MASVRITFSPDRAAAASRLREAISGAGYDVTLDQTSDLEELLAAGATRQGGATILVWSRQLVSSALQPGLLRKLRQNPKLIEVSADGVGPQAADGDNHVILLSGWRGQLFHPGWQRLAGELKRLCGPPPAVAPPPQASLERPAVRDVPPAAAPKAGAPDRQRRPGFVMLAVLAGAGLFGAGFATSSWLTTNAGPKSPSLTKAPAQGVADVGKTRIAPVAATPIVAAPRTANPGSGTSEPAPALANPLKSAAATGVPAAKKPSRTKATRTADKEAATGSAKARPSPRKDTKRYSRRNSKLMRLFCQGSGRTTPECRSFTRATRR